MLKEIYIQKIKTIIANIDPLHEHRHFIFGSSLRNKKFYDVDIAVTGSVNTVNSTERLKEALHNSTLPYFFDVVALDATKKSFNNYVLNQEKKLWLT